MKKWRQKTGLIVQLIKDLERPILYMLTGVSTVIGILVWGIGRIDRPGIGLFEQFRSVFGSAYGFLFLLLLVSILVINRRWTGLAVIVGSWLILGMLELFTNRSILATWNEFFAYGAMLSSLVVTFFVQHELLDRSSLK